MALRPTTDRTRGRRRVGTALRVALGLVAASTLLGSNGPVRAQSTGSGTGTTPTLGGFSGTAAASGLHVEYNPEGLLPTGSPVDLNAPDALATIASGPSTFARAGIADPGDLLANPDALLAAADPSYPQGSIPPWPFRITAGSGVGAPAAESNPAPGLRARVTAEGGTSTAEAHGPGVTVPAVVTIGSSASYADTTTDGSSVTVHSRAEISAVDILGVIRIESIVTELTATSAGAGTTIEGGTVVSGVTVAGQPAEIDDDGIRGLGLDLGPVLAPLGIKVTLPGPTETAAPTTGQLASNGLRIEVVGNLENSVPGVGDLLDQLPPLDPIAPGMPSPEDLIAAAQANHVVTIELGRGSVSLNARAPAPRPAPRTSGAAPAASVGGSAAAPALVPAAPAASLSTGIGVLAALLLLVQPLIGDRLARVAAAQLAPDQEGCSWEPR